MGQLVTAVLLKKGKKGREEEGNADHGAMVTARGKAQGKMKSRPWRNVSTA